jgi:hypothetical protein
MRTVLLIGTAVAAIAAATLAALADDSSAELAAGGLTLLKSADIRMASEDLAISPHRVHVRYEFTTDSGHDIDTTVAFPLPKMDMYEFSERPIGETTGDPQNFVGFTVTENGRPIATQLQARALYRGRDVTAQVTAAGLPIGIYTGSFNNILDHLPQAKIDVLAHAGLMEVDGDARRPKWTVELMYYWTEHFPAGKTVLIEHEYRPVTGEQFFGDFSLSDAEQRTIWTKNYCMDAGTVAAARKQLADFARGKDPNNGATLLEAHTTGFVLTTGNNWKGPIGRFHLTLDKLMPGNTLSLCWPGTLSKTGPTRFESTLTNFAPKRDIDMVVISPPPAQ